MLKFNFLRSNMRLFLIFIFFLHTQVIQSQIPIYTWRDHFSYYTPKDIAFDNEQIFVLTENGIVITDYFFSYEKKISKVTGLSDIDLSSIAYSQKTHSLIIGYKNGNIDIKKGSTIYNIPDIKLHQMYGLKGINKIFPYDNVAYLACGFGIVKLDLINKVILETYYIGNNSSQVNVKDIIIVNDTIFAATDNGIYMASIQSNLLDFHNWKNIAHKINFIKKFKAIDYKYSKIFAISEKSATFENKNLLLGINPSDSTYQMFDTVGYTTLYGFVRGSDTLGVMQDTAVAFFDSLYNKTLYWNYEGENYNRGITATFMVKKNGYYWFNDTEWRFLIKANRNEHTYKQLKINTPFFNAPFDFVVKDDKVWATFGGYEPSTLNMWKKFKFWHRDSAIIKNHILWDYQDATAIEIDPEDDSHFFIGSWNYGLMEFKNNTLVDVYTQDNSSLTVANNTSFVRVPDLAYDNKGNLWILNFQNSRSLSVLTKNGVWKNFYVGEIGKEAEKILITQSGKIWLLLARYGGIVVYDPGENILDASDDRVKKLVIKDATGGTINTNVVSIAEDREGIIWVGTTEGVLTFYNPDDVFDDPNFYAERIILEIGEGIGQYLMKYETVTSIKVDGANRKWFGTASSGAFLMNSSCTRELLHFTTNNSPLPSNKINKIEIDEKNGEVYFATDKGIVSFKNDATEAKPYFDNPYVYPNPVKPGYKGYITFTGLAQDVDVKITDIAGNIVYHTKARGGTAVWDGKNFSGQYVKSGIYLAFCTDDTGKVTHVLKVLIIN